MKPTLILTVLLFTQLHAFVSLFGGSSMPGTLKNLPEKNDQLMFNMGLDWGGLKNSNVGFMARFDIQAKGNREYVTLASKKDKSGGTFEQVQEINSIRRRAYSLGLGVIVSPLQNRQLFPVIKASFSPTLMMLVNDEDHPFGNEVIPPTGLYRGTMKRLEAELHAKVSKNASLFISAGYQFGYLKKRYNFQIFQENREYIRQSLEGLTLKVGIMIR